MDKIIVITIQLAISILVGFLLVSFIMMGFNPYEWGIIARVVFLLVSASCMVGLIKITNNG
ncbi:hypothetical protein [Sphingobacterium faecium]|uniref:hypothetical protein n=1 Tax=Sphingobacterium faecium TaxID=34087 RepID=UPI002468C671|nr:hypothetical protein [Sphingobacterium faecium]MDH5825760.1 hypothetical protein [Sphingobacterium faecium]